MNIVLLAAPQQGISQQAIRDMALRFLATFNAHRLLVAQAPTKRLPHPQNQENSITCPSCDRISALETCHLDHIVPQSHVTAKFKNTEQNQGLAYWPEDNSLSHVTFNYNGCRLLQFVSPRQQKISYSMDGSNKLDACNLQFLCCYCNTRKRDQDWAVFAGGRASQPICNDALFAFLTAQQNIRNAPVAKYGG